MSERYVQLKDPDGSFYDPETKFHVCRDEVVELVPPIGKLTLAKLAGRGLIECDPPEEIGVGPASVPVEKDNAEPDSSGAGVPPVSDGQDAHPTEPPSKKRAGKKRG